MTLKQVDARIDPRSSQFEVAESEGFTASKGGHLKRLFLTDAHRLKCR